MKLTLKVELRDKPENRIYYVDTDLYTVVMWERRFKRKASDMGNGIGIEDLAYMAWEASKSNKIVVPVEFDSFVRALVNVEVVEQDAADFIQAEPTAAN